MQIVAAAGLFVAFTAAADYSSDPDRTVIRVNDSNLQLVGDTITVTATLTNNGSNDLRAFYYADHLSENLDVTTVAVTVDGSGPASYTYEAGSTGEVYVGTVSHRWVIETPPGLAENQPIGLSCVIEYTVTSSTAGSYIPRGYTWAGYDYDMVSSSAVFGYERGAPFLHFFTPADVWVDFAYAEYQEGTLSHPFATLAGALAAVPEGGMIKIKGYTGDNATDETPQITTAMRIEAVGGPVWIGRPSGPGKAASGTFIPETKAGSDGSGLSDRGETRTGAYVASNGSSKNSLDTDGAGTRHEVVGGTDPSDTETFISIDALAVQRAINEALGIDTGFDCDLDNNDTTDVVDVQLTINAALGL